MKNRVEIAIKNHGAGYNCSQAVLCAYSDLFDLDEKMAFRLAEGFGSGMGGLKETCGAVTAMFMVSSLMTSDGDMPHNASRHDSYETVYDLAKRFEEKNGTLICSKLLENPNHRCEHAKLCTHYVEDAALLIETLINQKC